MKTATTGFNGNLMAILFLTLTTPRLFSSPQAIWLECPKDVTINCEEDVSNLDKWGKVWIWENYVKREGPKPKTIIYNTNACGIGTIIRKWEYEDKNWKFHTCEQTITVVPSGVLFSQSDIIWPKSTELEGCNVNADPKSLPREFSYPRFVNKKCSQPMYSYRDMKFTVSDGCMKIIRDWKVIDWCQYVPNANPPKGVWTYTQVLKLVVKDSTAYIRCPKDTIVMAASDCKGAYVKLDTAVAFSKCGNISKIRNTSPYATAPGPDASGNYPIGTTKFFFIAEYGCGQEIKCEVQVKVLNKIAPSPYCLNGIIVALMPIDTNRDGQTDAGMVEVWAKDLDRGSFHKCGQRNLNFSFSSNPNEMKRIFTCDDLGKNEVEIWVTDSSGNQSFCRTTIEIQNNNARIPNCKRKDSLRTNPPALLSIGGQLTYPGNRPAENVIIEIVDTDSYSVTLRKDTTVRIKYDTIKAPSGTVYYVQKRDSVITEKRDTLLGSWRRSSNSNSLGHYSFLPLEKNKNYKLTPKLKPDPEGIDIDDAITLLRHLLGTEIITNPYHLLAADVNLDKVIDYADFNLLYSVINGSISHNQLPSHWRFVPKKFKPGPGKNLYQESFDEFLVYSRIQGNVSDGDFFVVKTGDINGSHTTLTGNPTKERTKTIEDSFHRNLVEAHKTFPNPIISGPLNLELEANYDGKIQFTIFSITGTKIYENVFNTTTGVNLYSIESLPEGLSGVHIYQLKSGTQLIKGKINFILN